MGPHLECGVVFDSERGGREGKCAGNSSEVFAARRGEGCNYG